MINKKYILRVVPVAKTMNVSDFVTLKYSVDYDHIPVVLHSVHSSVPDGCTDIATIRACVLDFYPNKSPQIPFDLVACDLGAPRSGGTYPLYCVDSYPNNPKKFFLIVYEVVPE